MCIVRHGVQHDRLGNTGHVGRALLSAVLLSDIISLGSALPPCKEDATLWDCVAWCEQEAPGSTGTLTGQSCAHLSSAARKAGAKGGPACMCYDADFVNVLKQCAPSCPEEKDTQEQIDEDDSDQICEVGADGQNSDGCSAAATITRRFVLYDVKYGEGFNLQREIYPRVGWVVAQLNEAVIKRCGSFGSGTCAQWTLVLPPWCSVVHWWTGRERVPWSAFFDPEALRKAEIPLLEFEDYMALVGGSFVDLAVTHTEDRLPKDQRYGQRGGFYGWAKERTACSAIEHHTWDARLKRWKLQYAGNCDGDIFALEYRCGLVSSRMDRDVVDLIAAAGRNITSVLIKKADHIGPPDNTDVDRIYLRDSMLFAEPIREAGENFIANVLGGSKYVAAHCRRTDFLRVRAGTTPGVDAIAEQINSVFKQHGIDTLFVATDAPDDLQSVLKSKVRGSVYFFLDAANIVGNFDHPGKTAAVEMWIAARADFFIGSQESRFTAHIQLERGWLGKPTSTSEREFCKVVSSSSTPCIAPTYRHPSRRGVARSDYQ